LSLPVFIVAPNSAGTSRRSLPEPTGSLSVTAVVPGTEAGAMFSLHSTVIVSPTSSRPLVGPLEPLRNAIGTGPALSWGARAENDAWLPAASWISLSAASATVKVSTDVSCTPAPSVMTSVAVEPDVDTDASVPSEGTLASVHPSVHGAGHVARGSPNCTVTRSTRPSWSTSSI
jgi:hypothetical protein